MTLKSTDPTSAPTTGDSTTSTSSTASTSTATGQSATSTFAEATSDRKPKYTPEEMKRLFAEAFEKENGRIPDLPVAEPDDKIGPTDFKANGFILEDFRNAIADKLDGKCMGYSWVLNHSGQFLAKGKGGWRQTAPNGENLEFEPENPFKPGSVNKPLTATVACKVIDKWVPDSFAEKAYKYLPKFWDVAEEMKDISFHQLLSHNTGLSQLKLGERYDPQKLVWTTGKDADDKAITFPEEKDGGYYDNSNYSIFRIILPFIVCPEYMANFEGDDEAMDLATQMGYQFVMEKFLGDKIFWPKFTGDSDQFDDMVLGYLWPQDGRPGYNMGNSTPWMGAMGIIISCMKMADFARKLRHHEVLVPASVRTQMFDNYYGLKQYKSVYSGKYYWGHRGKITLGGGDKIDGMTPTGIMWGVMLMFDNDYEGVLFINSELGEGEISNVLMESFESSFT